MAEYKRWMAYLYNYENGFKRNCIGTARIERRGTEARTTVSIQVPSLTNERLKTFYYVRSKEGIRGIEVGEFTVNGSLGSWQVSMNANDMAGSGMRLEHMDGFLICRDSSKYYASAWDERPVLPSEVHMVLQDYGQAQRAREAVTEQKSKQLEEKVIETRTEPEVSSTQNDNSQNRMPRYDYTPESRESTDTWRNVRTEEDIRERRVGQPLYPLEETKQTTGIPEETRNSEIDPYNQSDHSQREDKQNENYQSKIQNHTENITAQDMEKQDTQTVPVDMVQRIFENCPVIWPFSDPWADRCVKLELEDIGLLPVKLWQLTANSFLMHSYYGYRHLVLARKTEGGRQTYELLVPGIYNERERELADIFGFRNFRCAKSRPVNVGEYGYWSMPVEFD